MSKLLSEPESIARLLLSQASWENAIRKVRQLGTLALITSLVLAFTMLPGDLRGVPGFIIGCLVVMAGSAVMTLRRTAGKNPDHSLVDRLARLVTLFKVREQINFANSPSTFATVEASLELILGGEQPSTVLEVLDTEYPRLLRTLDIACFKPVLNRNVTEVATPAIDPPSEKLAIAILKVLEHIGDESAVRRVEALTKARAAEPRGEAIRSAALNALPVMKERVARERPKNTLLRPSSSTGDSLLRPAGQGEGSPDEILLRAHESENL